jgi:alkylation response protein AidB-like acyl-CoA dehydrogenase
VRAFLEAELPADLQHKVLNHLRLSKDDYVRWHKILARQGWVAPGWPQEFGGPGWTPAQRHIFEEECARAGTPPIMPFGVNMVAPVIMAFGSQAQKDHYLPRILSCEDWWCQGYSEPGAGSDLASLKTTAVRDGDHYIVNGQKTWTTLAQHADMIFCLVRTDPDVRKQEGISFLLIDMKPRHHGAAHHHAGRGPRSERGLLRQRARAGGQPGRPGKPRLDLRQIPAGPRAHRHRRRRPLQARAGAPQAHGRPRAEERRPLIEDPLFGAKVAELEIELMALETTVLRVLAQAHKAPGPEASVLKVRGTEIQQRLTELMVEAAGPMALPFDRPTSKASAHSVASTTTSPRRCCRTTSITARPRSTAARTRSNATSSPR